MRTDWVGVLEAAGAAEQDDATWARGVVDAARDIFPSSGFTGGVGLTVVQHDAGCGELDLRLVATSDAWRSTVARTSSAALLRLGPRVLRAFYYPSAIAGLQSEFTRGLGPRDNDSLRDYRRSWGFEDGVGIIVHPDPGLVLVLCAGYAGTPQLATAHRRLLARIGLHLEAGFRLRRRPNSVLAIIRPDGKVLHLEPSAVSPEDLRARTKSMEHARRRAHRRDPRSVELWQAMVGGRASIVERIDGGQRLYFVVENAAARHRFRAFTRDEAETVAQAGRGLPAKLVAYGLGVSEPAVSSRLASATAKLGLCTRTELLRLAALLTRDPRARFDDGALTHAERDVLELLGQGLTNGEIARLRQRSVNTIANQVARLLEKTGAVNRRALALRA